MSFKPAFLFTDNMVLQRDREIVIWGEGDNGETVTIRFAGQEKSEVITGNQWEIKLKPVGAGRDFTLRMFSQNQSLEFENIAVGDIWLAGGQSNMEEPLLCTKDSGMEVQMSDWEDIRYITVPRKSWEEDEVLSWHFLPVRSLHAPWKVLCPETAGQMSAVAYYFAKTVFQKTQIPIGIIECNWGGTSVFHWLEKARLYNIPEVAKYTLAQDQYINSLNREEYEDKRQEYHKKLEQICISRNAGDPVPEYPPVPLGPKSHTRHGGLYETMLKTIVPVSMKGVLWYQGESDSGSKEMAKLYHTLLGAMIKNWREVFRNDQLHFMVMMLPEYQTECRFEMLRESQYEVSCTVPQVSLVNALDCGSVDNIHPFEKRYAAERMAYLALKDVYGFDFDFGFPKVINAVHGEENEVILSFDDAFLYMTADSALLKGFELREKDGSFLEASAKPLGDKVIVFSPEVKKPYAVRYACSSYPNANLYNSLRLPAFPFGEKIIGTTKTIKK